MLHFNTEHCIRDIESPILDNDFWRKTENLLKALQCNSKYLNKKTKLIFNQSFLPFSIPYSP